MTKIEKRMIIAVAVLLVMLVASIGSTVYYINQAGGMRQVIVDTGKEVKSIAREIAED